MTSGAARPPAPPSALYRLISVFGRCLGVLAAARRDSGGVYWQGMEGRADDPGGDPGGDTPPPGSHLKRRAKGGDGGFDGDVFLAVFGIGLSLYPRATAWPQTCGIATIEPYPYAVASCDNLRFSWGQVLCWWHILRLQNGQAWSSGNT